MNSLNKIIEQAKQQLEHMIDLNPEPMLLVDRNGTVIRTNKALLKFLQISNFHEILGRELRDLFCCKDTLFFNRFLEDQSGHDVCEMEVSLLDGRSHVLQFMFVGSGTEMELFVVIVRDVTDEKERAKHLEKKYKKEAVRALMGGLMHNVNQPLTVIMVKAGLMQLALEKGVTQPEQLKKNLNDITTFAMRIADILKNVKSPKDFVTESYIKSIDILDLKRSGSRSEEVESWSDGMLDALLAVLDTHEPGALRHALHTGEYAAFLARHMELNEKKRYTVKHCAFLHDIGKIGIPDAILQKPAPLTVQEMEVMKKHAEIGYNLIRNFPFLNEEAEVAYVHHERFDGTGYPRGLPGKDICLSARIVAVADVFDVLRVGRPYHNAVTLENAVGEIKAGAGTRFDPEVVKIFESCYMELDALQDESNSTGSP